jgi:NADPH:quinone reductase-like Zn-dependent oxidoreductase
MKAIVIREYGGVDALQLTDVGEPQPGPWEIKVRVVAAGINAVDWKLRSGALRGRMPLLLPTILGRDVAGEVVEVGSEVMEFEEGDRVMGLVQHGYAEYVVARSDAWAKVPDELPFTTAGILPLVGLAGCELVEEAVNVRPGQLVLVTGAVGAVGRVAVYASRRRGAHVLAGVRASQRETAEELDAEHVFALDDPSDLARLPKLDAIADTVDGEVLDRVLERLKPGGIVGSVVGESTRAKEEGIAVHTMLAHADPYRLEELGHAAVAGAFTLPIERTFPLERAREAQRLAEGRGVGKVVLTP